MAACLNLAEMQTLCFDLDVNFDELPGQALSPKITGLLRLIGRDDRWPDLVAILSHAYPKMEWPAVVELEQAAVTATELDDEPDQPGVMAQGPGATAVGPGAVCVGGNVGGSIHAGDVHHYHGAPELTFPITNLPPARPHFTGRAEQMESLLAARQDATTTITQTIAGLGGVGKSRLMLEFAHRQRPHYEIIWWLRVDEALAADLLALGRQLRLPIDGLDQPDALQRVCVWLNGTPRKWLLLCDNADQIEPRDLFQLLPNSPTGRILITSRNPSLWPCFALGYLYRGRSGRFLAGMAGGKSRGAGGQRGRGAKE
jgi:hypothetical protein